MLAEGWISPRMLTAQESMTLSGLRMALRLLHHLRFGLLFIQNKKHELKQNPSNPGNSGVLLQHLAPHPQQDRKRRKGDQQNEHTKPNHRNWSQVRKKTWHSTYHRTRIEKPKSTEASQDTKKMSLLLLQSSPLHNGHGLERNKKWNYVVVGHRIMENWQNALIL